MKLFDYDISTLFGSLNNNNLSNSINLNDYNMIKSGSYKKLLKSYYSKDSEKTEAKNNTDSKKNVSTKDATGLAQMKKDADELKSASKKLSSDDLWKQTDGKYDMDKIATAVKDFAGKYNSVLKQSEKVTSKDVSQDVKYMNSMTGTMSKALSRIGVNIESDGALKVDEEALKKADVKSVKAMFSGVASYGDQIADKASDISKDAVMNSSVYSNTGKISSTLSGMFEQWI